MATLREDERQKEAEKQQLADQPQLDIGTQAMIGIERDYLAKSTIDSTDLGGSPVELGNIPPNLLGKSLYYISVDLSGYEDDDLIKE